MIFVSPTLRILNPPPPVDPARREASLARDFTVISGPDSPDGKPAPRTAYRRLDPEYFAWLTIRAEKLRSMADAGKLSRADFLTASSRWAAVRAFAEQFWEPEVLEAARERMVSLESSERPYPPPEPDADSRGQRVRAPADPEPGPPVRRRPRPSGRLRAG